MPCGYSKTGREADDARPLAPGAGLGGGHGAVSGRDGKTMSGEGLLRRSSQEGRSRLGLAGRSPATGGPRNARMTNRLDGAEPLGSSWYQGL